MAKLKLKLKFNSLEFEIEGEEAVVKEEFEKFKSFITNEFVARIQIPLPQEQGSHKDLLEDSVHDNQLPVLSEIVKKDLPNSESEWVLIYGFYASNYGENSFTEQDIKNCYTESKRTSNNRTANLSNNIKSILNKSYVKMLNDTDYIFLEEGKKKVLLIVSGTESKVSTKKTPTKGKNGSKISEKVKGTKGPKANNLKAEVFDVHPEGKVSLEDFLKEKKIGDSSRERILVIAFYIKNILEIDSFTDGNIEYAYKALSLKNKPLHLRQAITDIKNKKFEIESVNSDWSISRVGEKYVDEKLPIKGKND